jgi:putative glutamine amidotransferase
MMLIGLTDPMDDRAKLSLYADWLKGEEPDVDVALLSPTLRNAGLLSLCDALVLSGGGDMHPRFFGREDLLPLCKEVNEERDAF